MAKKKSKRFIIPSIHFLTTAPKQKESVKDFKPKREIPKIELKEETAKIANKTADEAPSQKDPKPMVNIKPKPLEIKNVGRRNSALSLSSLKRNKIEEEKLKKKQSQTVQTEDLPKDPFTEETFLKIWNSYIDHLHDKGEKILASILKADFPKLKKNIIHLSYPNEMMKAELLKVRPKVLRYLREKLNNYSIDFEVTVNEDKSKRFAYTPQEKYELLKEKNAAISLLRKTFNLEL